MILLRPEKQIIHGGNLEHAIQRYGMPKFQEPWIDLSTGISPWSYPVGEIPENIWHELPPINNDALRASAANYYHVAKDNVLATPGSQIAIRLIPQLVKPSSVAVPALGYQEHAISWQMANHQTIKYNNTQDLLNLIDDKQVEHVVLINPNNPSGEKLNLKDLEEIISKVSGLCLVDEAFIDVYDDSNNNENLDIETIHSASKMNQYRDHQNLIILRSMGKFFGLAGIRLGFVIGSHPMLQTLAALLEPWSISYPNQYIGIQALQDKQWQQQQRINIKQQQSEFHSSLSRFFDQRFKKDYKMTNAGLFNTVFTTKAELEQLHNQLARQGVWARLCNDEDELSWLRFGLPKTIAEFEERVARMKV